MLTQHITTALVFFIGGILFEGVSLITVILALGACEGRVRAAVADATLPGAPSKLRAAPSKLRTAPSKLRAAPSKLRAAPSQLWAASSSIWQGAVIVC